MSNHEQLGTELAFPCLPPIGADGASPASGYPFPEMGLRKRELFAAMALQGLLANGSAMTAAHNKDLDLAQIAVGYADKLLRSLSE